MPRARALAAAVAFATLSFAACGDASASKGGSAPAATAPPAPADAKDTRELIAAVKEYAANGCAAAKQRLDRCRPCETSEQRPQRDLLYAFCAEQQTPETARALYEAIVIAYPATEVSDAAMLRLRQLENPAASVPPAASTDPAPIPRNRPEPRYPRLAEAAGIEGRVLLRFDVQDDGRIANARVLESQPPRLFDAAALSALAGWSYEPKAASGVQILLRFQRGDEAAAGPEPAK